MKRLCGRSVVLLMFLGLSILSSSASLGLAAIISAKEAREFCEKIWFPALRLKKSTDPADEQFTPIDEKMTELLKLYTDSVEITDPNNIEFFHTPVLKGREEISKFYRSVLTSYPSWIFEIRAIYPTNDGFVLHYTGKDLGPVKEFEGVDILKLSRRPGVKGPRAWQIRSLQGFYDRVPFRQTTPALSPNPSKTEESSTTSASKSSS